MKLQPHRYQLAAIYHILTHPVCALFLDMGLGKTAITLTALNALFRQGQAHKVLVVAPLRVARDTWPEEAAKWDHLKHLKVSKILGAEKKRLAALSAEADIYLINRENLAWLRKAAPRASFDVIVFDELSGFKSRSSQRHAAARFFRRKARRVIGLTGTPAPNGLIDLWAQIYLLDQGERLGASLVRFRDTYFHPVRWRDGGIPCKWEPTEATEQRIYRRIADIAISMQSQHMLTDLPECFYLRRPVILPEAAASAADIIKNDLVVWLDDNPVEAANAAVAASKLQQIASGAVYDQAGNTIPVHSEKIEELAELVEEANGQNVLVAYWFRHELERIRAAFPEARPLNTAQDMEDWNQGEISFGLIHPASAGHGLNLQAGGHILIWFTLPWSLEMYLQTNARLHRQGQHHPVTIQHLIAAGSIDEQVFKALREKNVTQYALIEAVKAQLNFERAES